MTKQEQLDYAIEAVKTDMRCGHQDGVEFWRSRIRELSEELKCQECRKCNP